MEYQIHETRAEAEAAAGAEVTAALADLIAEAQTATTGQIKTVCSSLRKIAGNERGSE